MALRLLAVAVAAVMATSVAAQGATITPEGDVPSWGLASVMTLTLDVLPLTYDVVPLTQTQGLNQSDTARGLIHIYGQLVVADVNTYTTINQSSQIAYLSCDNLDSNGFITPSMMLQTLMQNKPRAILLYTTVGNVCELDGSGFDYQAIFTMADGGDANLVLNYVNGTMSDQMVLIAITGNTTSSEQASGNQGSNNSAVAMSVLYSITGLITLMFLIIIGTGAIRAHRYPERYGPRSGYGGQPRQSRAKGLARAVLETLPIIKFGSPEPPKPDPTVELERQPPAERSRDATKTAQPSTAALQSTETDVPQLSGAINAQPEGSTSSAKAADNTAVAEQERLGCSICTDDFAVGEDVRVLPCDHKFHPACVDPWLVNVSGTCPLCRLDLRPGATEKKDPKDPQASETPLPPPIDLDGHESDADEAATNRRRSRFFDLNRLRHASVQERIEVLRQYRLSQRPGEGAEEGAEERGRRARVADRLREKFRIRTRTQARTQSPTSDPRPEGSS